MKIEQQLDIEKFKPAIQGAIDFLAPYFKISERQLRTFLFPTLRRTEEKNCFFSASSNLMFFHEEDHKKDYNIGHEASHWIHYWMNPLAWPGTLSGIENLLRESVAKYGELIYCNKEEIFENPKISLPVLSRKSFSDIFYNKYSQSKLKSLWKNLMQKEKELDIK